MINTPHEQLNFSAERSWESRHPCPPRSSLRGALRRDTPASLSPPFGKILGASRVHFGQEVLDSRADSQPAPPGTTPSLSARDDVFPLRPGRRLPSPPGALSQRPPRFPPPRCQAQNMDMTLPERPSSPSPRGSVRRLRFLANSRCARMYELRISLNWL